MFDYSKLIGLVASLGLTISQLAEMIDVNVATVSKKLKCFTDASGKDWYFNTKDIVKICAALGIARCDIGDYFFTPKVKET